MDGIYNYEKLAEHYLRRNSVIVTSVPRLNVSGPEKQKLKEKISEYQMLKMQKEKIEAEKNREEAEKRAQREELRQQYFDMQRKNIEDFKL